MKIDRIVSAMIGSDVKEHYPKVNTTTGKVVLEAKGISTRQGVSNVDLTLHAGEVYGLGGVLGAGRTEMPDKPGDMIVVDTGGDTETSVCGGLMGGLAQNRGIRGMIVDGAGCDIDELEDLGWPIWTRAITVRGTHTMFSGRKEELSINVPISCGGVVVNPGDFIVADTIGVFVAPLAKAGVDAGQGTGRPRGSDAPVGEEEQDRGRLARRVRPDLIQQLPPLPQLRCFVLSTAESVAFATTAIALWEKLHASNRKAAINCPSVTSLLPSVSPKRRCARCSHNSRPKDLSRSLPNGVRRYSRCPVRKWRISANGGKHRKQPPCAWHSSEHATVWSPILPKLSSG